jgi:glycosyltransferase involved in cell wall biosynthesis
VKVLVVCHGYPPFGVAGVERVSAQTARGLIERGHEVTVFTRRPSVAPPSFAIEREDRDGVAVATVVGGGPTFEQFPGHEPALEAAFARMLAETVPDVVLLSHLLHHSPGYVDIAHRWGIPVVLELHDFYVACPRVHLQRRSGDLCDGPHGGAACAVHCFSDDPQAALRWSLRAHTFRRALQEAEVVICPSQFVADSFATLRGNHAIQVIGNGVDIIGAIPRRAERDAAAHLHVASIGVTVEHKGFHVVVEALAHANLPAARYTIFGVPAQPQASSLYAAADDVPGLDLRLFGGFEPRQLPVLLSDVDALVVPSLVAETYSIVAREAFACGVPVLASDIGALPEAIRPNANGLLFPPGDARRLAALLERLSAEPAQRRALARGIRLDDWISAATRVMNLEQILSDAAETGVAGRRATDADERVLRDALVAELL